MYLQLMKNVSRLGITNLTISKLSSMLDLEEQKPFLLVKPEGEESEYLSFVHKNLIYMTPFKTTNLGIVARLKTVLVYLDRTPIEIDVPLFLVRNGIPIKKISFEGKKAIISDIDVWLTLTYQKLPQAKTVELLRDLRDLLYV